MSKAECYEQSVRAENLARGNSTSTSSDIKFNANFDFPSTNGHFAFTSSCYSSDLLDSG